MKGWLVALMMITSTAVASGWHDYALPIAPGFTIYRNNTFEICLGETDGLILFCPEENGTYGPIIAYSTTDDAILTWHTGVTRNKSNPSIPEGDPSKEYFFLTARADKRVIGPLSRAEWQERKLPPLDSVTWTHPRNPNFWLPLLGDAMFLLFVLGYFGWPIPLVVGAFALLVFLYRRRQRAKRAAA